MVDPVLLRPQFDYSNTTGNTPSRPLVGGGMAVQQADALLYTLQPNGSLRATDLRPMAEQLASGPLHDALQDLIGGIFTVPAMSLKANLTNSTAVAQNVSLATLAAPGNPLGDMIDAKASATSVAALAGAVATKASIEAVDALTSTVAGKLAKASNLADLTDIPAARGNLGLGSAATRVAGYSASQLPPLDANALLPISVFPPGSIVPFDQPTGATGDGVAADGQTLADMATRLTNATINKMGRSGYLKPGIYKSDRQIVLQPKTQQWAGLFSDGSNGAKILFTNPNSAGIKVIYPQQAGVGRAACPSVTVRGIALIAQFNKSDIVSTDGTIPGTEHADTGARVAQSSVIGGSSAGQRLASTAFQIAFDNASGAAAAPTPAVDLDGLTIDHLSDEALQPSLAGWAYGARIFGLNGSKIRNCVFWNMYSGSTAIDIDTNAARISVEHYITAPVIHGTNCTGIRIGRQGNDVPLQGIYITDPSIVIGGNGSGICIIAEASPNAVLAVGDHLVIMGGHLGQQGGIAVYSVGWGSSIVEGTYILGAGIGVYAQALSRLKVNATIMTGGIAGARAVQLHNCAPNATGGNDIQGVFSDFTVPPVLTTGTTARTIVRGIVNERSSPVALLENSNGNATNVYLGMSNGKPAVSPPNDAELADGIVTAGWLLSHGRSLKNQVVISNGVVPATAINNYVAFTVAGTITLPDPAQWAVGSRSMVLGNATGSTCTFSYTSGGTTKTNLPTLPAGYRMEIFPLGASWEFLSRSSPTA